MFEHLDQNIFHLINHWQTGQALESLLIFWRNKTTWIPLYLLFAVWVLIRYRWRGLWFLIAMGLTVGLADQISAHVLKPFFHRMRPCQLPVEGLVLRINCGQGLSFPSSHATDHFAVAAFLWPFFLKHKKIISYSLLLWASIVAFAQIFVGVHYPSDVLFGSVLGWLIGRFIYWAYLHIVNKSAI